MTRLLSTFRWDLTRQFRYGFYYVSALLILILVALLHQLPGDGSIDFGLLIPALVVLSLVMTTFYFMGALVLLEKGEGTLAALVVTPVRDTEYLASKVASLSLLAMVETLLLILLIYGTAFEPLPLLAGMSLLGGFYTLIGFVAIARYDTINEYLLPSILITIALGLPLLDHFGLWESVLFYLHPVQPALVLLRAAFAPMEMWQLAYGVLGASAWVGLSFVWARQLFHRFVVRAAGSES